MSHNIGFINKISESQIEIDGMETRTFVRDLFAFVFLTLVSIAIYFAIPGSLMISISVFILFLLSQFGTIKDLFINQKKNVSIKNDVLQINKRSLSLKSLQDLHVEIGASTRIITISYRICIYFFKPGKLEDGKIFLIACKKKEDAMNVAKEISDFLNIKVVDDTLW